MANKIPSAITVAGQILHVRRDTGTTPMHIIKLVYLCHGWMLGIHNKPLIKEFVEAWRYGPVVPVVYHKFKSFRGDPVDIVCEDNAEEFDSEQKNLIDEVLTAYKSYSALSLSTITHQPDTPWHHVYQDGRGEGAIIPNKLIRAHYRKRAEM